MDTVSDQHGFSQVHRGRIIGEALMVEDECAVFYQKTRLHLAIDPLRFTRVRAVSTANADLQTAQ